MTQTVSQALPLDAKGLILWCRIIGLWLVTLFAVSRKKLLALVAQTGAGQLARTTGCQLAFLCRLGHTLLLILLQHRLTALGLVDGCNVATPIAGFPVRAIKTLRIGKGLVGFHALFTIAGARLVEACIAQQQPGIGKPVIVHAASLDRVFKRLCGILVLFIRHQRLTQSEE